MSSKIEFKKVCERCGKEFIARKMSTRYCSKRCAEHAYKDRMRQQKKEFVANEVHSIPQNSIKDKDFLTPSEVSTVIGVCRRTIYNYLAEGKIPAVQFKGKTLIRRSDIEKIFDSPNYEKKTGQPRKPITEFYFTKEVLELTGLSNSGLYKVAGQEGFPKTLHKGKTLWSKRHIDQWLSKRQPREDITEWYSAQEIMAKFGMTSLQAVYCFISEHAIPKKKVKREVFYSKTHVDRAKGVADESEPTEYTYPEAIARFGMTRDALYHYIKTYHVPTRKEGKYTYIDKAALDAILAPLSIDG